MLVSVATTPVSATHGLAPEDEHVGLLREAQEYLATVAKEIDDVPVTTSVSMGSAPEEILKWVAGDAADAIVMATHGRTGPTHLLLGSVAEAVVAKSPVPVFVVPPIGGEPLDTGHLRVLVALDGTEFAEAALESVLRVFGSSTELVLLRVAEQPDDALTADDGRVIAYIDQLQEESRVEAQDYLTAVAERIRSDRAGVVISTEAVLDIPSNAIVEAAARHRVGAVAMATHGRTGVRRAVVGSVAGAVVRRGGVPVLLVNPETLVSQQRRPTGEAVPV
jgi:nucleotide-binding universal stress UspA family protein